MIRAAAPRTARQPSPPAPQPSWAGRRTIHFLIMFVASVLVVNGLIGEKGLIQTRRARAEHAEVAASIERLRAENDRLREEARWLREDPQAIEDIARRELGLIKPGERLFIIRDLPSPAPRPR